MSLVSDAVTLGFSIRSQLLALQGTQSVIDKTQLRLASGKSVNTAIDDPQNFFASRELGDRASDLERLLDGMGQNLQTIRAAADAVEAIGQLVQQAEAVTQQARDLLPTLQTEPRAVGNVDLSEVRDLTSLTGISNGDRLRFTFRDQEDTNFSPAPVFVSLSTNMSGAELVGAINDLNTGLPEDTIEASLNLKGELEVKTVNGDIMMIEFVAGAAGFGTQATNQAIANALGFQQQTEFSNNLLNQNSVGFVVYPEATLTSFAFTDATTGEVARRSSLINNLQLPNGTPITIAPGFLDGQYQVGVNQGTTSSINLDATTSIQEFIDAINTDNVLGSQIQADFIEETGQITIRAIGGEVDSIELGIDDDPGGAVISVAFFGFGARVPVGLDPAFDPDIMSIQLPKSTGLIQELEQEYDSILAQINMLAEDGSYKGINLVNGDSLITTFNESFSSQLITEGTTLTSAGLGLEEANFNNVATIETTLTDVRESLETIRSFGTSLANDLNIVTTRETMTENIINTLTAGSDRLTLADQNEEGAKMLALQTRQQIQVSILAFTGNEASIADFLGP